MGFATVTKLLFLLFWPVIILLIFYFNDKEKFKMQIKKMFNKDS